MIKRIILASVASLFIGAVVAAWALTPAENTVQFLPIPTAALSITSPMNGATVAGTITISGVVGVQWVNVAAYDASNGDAKVALDVTPSGRAFKLSLPTATMSNGTHDLFIEAFSTPPGVLGGTSASVPLTVVVSNGGGGPGGNAVAANDFLNSIGVNMNNCYQPGYSSIPAWCNTAITYMGIRGLRMISHGSTGGVTSAQQIAFAQATGSKWIVGLDSTPSENTPALMTSQLLALAESAAAAGVLIAVEGANEPANWPVLWNGVYGGGGGNVACPPGPAGHQCSWVPVAQQQAAMYAAVKADTTNNVDTFPVWSTAGYIGGELDNAGVQCLQLNVTECANAGAVTLMPANTIYADVANEHNYIIVSGGTIAPVNNQAWLTAGVQVSPTGIVLNIWNDFGKTYQGGFLGHSAAQLATGVTPRVTTETGWYMPAGNTTAQNIGAKMLLNVLLSQFKMGYTHTFIYQIGDCTFFADPFGLEACTGSPASSSATHKPAATYIHNLTTILADTVEFTTGTLSYTVVSEPATVHDLLLQKSNNNFELIVWNEQCPSGSVIDNIHNTAADCTVPPVLQNVTVNLGGSHTTVNVYDPTVGTGLVAPCNPACTGISSVVLPLTDHPYIIEVIG